MKITVEVDGRIKFIYDDSVAEVMQEVGTLEVKRASHVEFDNSDGFWWADMSPVGGPRMGPFNLRHTALEVERVWLEENGIPRPL
jgi:hypothetical protein